MKFLPVKILGYAGREAKLEADPNPFAKVVLAHLKALETRRDPEARRRWKFRLVRGLYERGLQPKDVRQLFRLIDWLMELPPRVNKQFWKEVHAYEGGTETYAIPYRCPEKRQQPGEQCSKLDRRLTPAPLVGEDGSKLMPEISALEDSDKFRALNISIANATTLDEVRQACAAAAAPPEPPKKSTRRKRG